MKCSSPAYLIFSRLILIAAVLLGQFSGGSVCCCWIKHCTGQRAEDRDDAQDRKVGGKIACPKCIARWKKSNELRDRVQDSSCHCVPHDLIAVSQGSDSDIRIRLDDVWNAVATAGILSASSLDDAPLDGTRHPHFFERRHWQARACIWRI
jgi:hypothetical protein